MSSHVMTINLESMTTTKESLSSRLVYALNRMKISQSELARLIGVKPQIIQYLCTSNANKSKFAFEIAIALGVNPNWLIAGRGPMLDLSNIHHTSPSQPKVPLLGWNNIMNWLNKSDDLSQQETKFIFITNEPTPASYALSIVDTSMIPRFEIGTTLVIDPSLKPNNGDFVIAKISHQQQAIVRQLIFKMNKYYLSPMNSSMYKEIELNAEDKILGVVRQTYFEFIR